MDDLELATLGWVDWFNHSRIHSSLGYRTPAEIEEEHYRHNHAVEQPLPAELRLTNPGRFRAVPEQLHPRNRRPSPIGRDLPEQDSDRPPVGAVLAEQNDEWAEGRRYLGLDVLARCRVSMPPTTNPEIGADDLPALTA